MTASSGCRYIIADADIIPASARPVGVPASRVIRVWPWPVPVCVRPPRTVRSPRIPIVPRIPERVIPAAPVPGIISPAPWAESPVSAAPSPSETDVVGVPEIRVVSQVQVNKYCLLSRRVDIGVRLDRREIAVVVRQIDVRLPCRSHQLRRSDL